MTFVLSVLIFIIVLGVFVVLFIGVIAMVRGGEFNRKYGNVLMRWRVILQFAVVLLVLLYLLAK